MKIVWICHFTNSEIQSLIPLWKKRNEFASWIPNTFKAFENRKDIDLHVISPHEYLIKTTRLTLRNIHFYFIPYGIPLWHRHWPQFFKFDIYSNYYSYRKKIQKIIKNIQPDIINLIGVENAYYSSSILSLKKDYPILITVQGFISQKKEDPKLLAKYRKNINVEEKILKTFKYFCGEQDSSAYISAYNPNHVFFRLYFPVNETLVHKTKDKGKIYDCIYFGKLVKTKGAEDYIRVIAEIKKIQPEIKACIVGEGNATPFRILSKVLNCEKNIEFIGFAKSQKELFEYVKSSKVFLVPPLQERLSSTIREAMFLKVPIVAYATGGIPYINEFDENIYLVKIHDIKGMAEKVLLLLKNEQLREQLAEKAYNYCMKEFNLKVNSERLLSAYHKILNNNIKYI